MYIKIHNKTIELIECNTFIKRFKSYKLNLFPIEKGLFFNNKRILNTYFFCQRIDALFIDDNNNIIDIYNSLKSEKIRISLKSKHLIILPENTCKALKIGEKITIINDKEKKD